MANSRGMASQELKGRLRGRGRGLDVKEHRADLSESLVCELNLLF